MGVIYRAKDLDDAIRYASSLKMNGSHDWFRGQLQNYPLRSSFTRLDKSEQEEALVKIGRFEQWAKNTPGLEGLAQNVDTLAAVAQHYGLPTNYIDFTVNPEVAGFFAVHNPKARVLSGDSCIMCLNTGDLEQFWRSLPPKYPPPEFIRLEVPNLWRLESQEGCFLFCPYANFEHIYDLDRIFFPCNGPPTAISVTKIYPERKSALEILLDQFFMNEQLIKGTKEIEQLPAFRAMAHVTIPIGDGWDPELCSSSPSILDSWMPVLIRPWVDHQREVFARVSAKLAISMEINFAASPSRVRSQVEIAMVEALARDPLLRNHLIEWHICSDLPESRIGDITSKLERLWDGIRIHPYSLDQIAHSIAQCVALWTAMGNKNANLVNLQEEAADETFGNSLRVEFGSEDGSYSKGFAGRDLLLGAVRKDIGKYLKPDLAPLFGGNITGLLQAVQDPKRLFEFPPLADVFARQLAPSQILFRDSSAAIFYSPARVDRFGLE
jgi:hypothetical protein